ncbi:hypothetical protein [Cupriavidus lacunae]|uniref:Uncharacterized protein n=1 Tax=Cupriavidus lacunae TaxID=2666307 RepID=A0A370NKG3_9BURK|nr:hypothetical protein [Cupriavidus lacunae]RDK06092.1 hypothetical protein DN412_33280 [Cupriavidus lacunae]
MQAVIRVKWGAWVGPTTSTYFSSGPHTPSTPFIRHALRISQRLPISTAETQPGTSTHLLFPVSMEHAIVDLLAKIEQYFQLQGPAA